VTCGRKALSSAAQNIDKEVPKRTSYSTSKNYFCLEISDDSLSALGHGGGAARSALAPLSVDIRALGVNVSLDLNVEVKLGSASGQVLEDGDVGVAISSLTNTKDNRGPVASVLALGAVPNTSVFNAVALLVDIVLSRGAGAIPDVVLSWSGLQMLTEPPALARAGMTMFSVPG